MYRVTIIASIVIFAGLIAGSLFFVNQTNADSGVITTSITVTVCGNSIVEVGEQCDDGNIESGDGCSSSCQNEGPICGNNVIESGEQCDDGNGLSGDGCSASCQKEGAGGGISFPVEPPEPTSVILKGKAYPHAKVNILQDGILITNTFAKANADFEVRIADITTGTYTFGLWAEDSDGERSITFSFTTSVSAGTITTVGGIFIPPTITVDKNALMRGEVINFRGQSAPGSNISLHINPPGASANIVRSSFADNLGIWQYSFDTSNLAGGFHKAKSKSVSKEGLLSTFSKIVSFFVAGKEEETPGEITMPRDGDINGDLKVNLIDFSILLYHWEGSSSEADFNSDGVVNIYDLSILLFWWTG